MIWFHALHVLRRYTVPYLSDSNLVFHPCTFFRPSSYGGHNGETLLLNGERYSVVHAVKNSAPCPASLLPSSSCSSPRSSRPPWKESARHGATHVRAPPRIACLMPIRHTSSHYRHCPHAPHRAAPCRRHVQHAGDVRHVRNLRSASNRWLLRVMGKPRTPMASKPSIPKSPSTLDAPICKTLQPLIPSRHTAYTPHTPTVDSHTIIHTVYTLQLPPLRSAASTPVTTTCARAAPPPRATPTTAATWQTVASVASPGATSTPAPPTRPTAALALAAPAIPTA